MPKRFPFIYFRWRQICPVPSPCSRGPTILARCLYLPYLCSPHSPGLFDCLLYVALLYFRPAAWTSRSKRTSPMRPTISMRSSGRSGCAEDKDEKILGLCFPLTVFCWGGGVCFRDTCRLRIRKIQFAPETNKSGPKADITKQFIMSDKPVHLEASLEKEVGNKRGYTEIISKMVT